MKWTGLPPFLLAAGAALSAGASPPAAGAPAGVERRLHVSQVEASSFLWNDWNQFQENYHPLYLADDDPATAWVEGAKGPGIGEWVRFKLTPLGGSTRVRLRVRNGYQKSPRLFAANARAKEITVKLVPSGATLTSTLGDAQGWQELVIDQPAGALGAVELAVRSIYPGKKYEDLCLSDVQVFVTSTAPENPAFEKSKLDKVRAWKAERVQAAAQFKAAAGRSLPVGAQYRFEKDPALGLIELHCQAADFTCGARAAAARASKLDAAHASSLALVTAALANRFADFAPVQAAAHDHRKLPFVEGLCSPELSSCSDGCWDTVQIPVGGVAYWSAQQIGVFDVKQAPPLAKVLDDSLPECRRADSDKSYSWARRELVDGKQVLRALLHARCASVESREGTVPGSEWQLLVFDERGRLDADAGADYVNTFQWRERPEGPLLVGARHYVTDDDSGTLSEGVAVAKQ